MVQLIPEKQRNFAFYVVQKLQRAGFTAYWAGGCVRDQLLGYTPKDYDVATDARPGQIRRVFRRHKTLAVGADFGTITVVGPRGAGQVEVTTFRQEAEYSDGRHPDRVWFSSAQEDAQRRDFTINGIFYDPVRQEYIDYVGGQQDIHSRQIRAIGDPRKRFQEDKLRMLRAVRFAAVLGFTIEPATFQAIVQMADQILQVSAERIAGEMERLLTAPFRAEGVRLLVTTGLARPLLPEILLPEGDSSPRALPPQDGMREVFSVPLETHKAALAKDMPSEESIEPTQLFAGASQEPVYSGVGSRPERAQSPTAAGAEPVRSIPGARPELAQSLQILERLKEPSFALALAGLLAGMCTGRQVIALGRRWRLSNQVMERAAWLVDHADALHQATSQPWSKLQPLLIHPGIHELLALMEAKASLGWTEAEDVQFCYQKLALPPELLNPPPLITGDDLIRLGIPQGPIYKKILEQVRAAQLDGRIHSPEQALHLARQIAQNELNPELPLLLSIPEEYFNGQKGQKEDGGSSAADPAS
ncbi:MAG: CCA tRNA nucleotidyltransferase [Thermoguttaceae bacterium]|nr:CCA tRNA nucleotidyltransferase [Thermoguttaceae bacterium]MDW8037200.1 CCA tRNA nucleotidyltransferase [Thermoguttaceae bacterium]